MSNITPLDALLALGETDVISDGIPTNADEFAVMCFRLDGVEITATWDQVVTKLAELEAAEPLRLLRVERNRRIAATDWWASSDLTMTEAQTAYRQALRDITNTYTSLDDVVWPEVPNE